uniref:Uncharacterized protein n=1 Tax=Ditylenchus dipsaci TaxID=166011 RepID=A0A915CU56_9BILA
MFSAILLLPALFLTIFKINKEISGNSALQILSYKTFTGAVNEDQSNAEEVLQKLNESLSALPDKKNYGPITLLNHFNGLEVNNKSKALIVSNNLVVNYKDLANKLQLGSGSLSFEETKTCCTASTIWLMSTCRD